MSAHVITVAQQKGGSGKTTLAIHLAVAFAKQGLSTMLFDTDPQGTLSHWHAERKQNDVGLIATSGWRLTRDLAMAREANDIIVIDTPPHAEMDIKVSTRAADLVMVPLQPSPADLWAVKETMNTVAGESTHAMVVLNRVVARANITQDIKNKLTALDVPFAKTELGSRVLFAGAMEHGMTVVDGFQNPSAKEVDALVKEVAAVLGVSLKGQTQATKTKKATKAKAAKKTTTKKTTKAKAATAKQEAAEPMVAETVVAAPVAKKTAKKATAKKAAPKKATKAKAAPAKAAAPVVEKTTTAAKKKATTMTTTTKKPTKATAKAKTTAKAKKAA